MICTASSTRPAATAAGLWFATAALVLIPSSTPLAQSTSAKAPSAETGRAVEPPHGCLSLSCLRGALAFERGRYATAAKRLETSLEAPFLGPSPSVLQGYVDRLLMAAVARERSDSDIRAAAHYASVARLVDHGGDFFAFRALRAALRTDALDAPFLQDLRRLGAFDTPYPGSDLLRLEWKRTVEGSMPERSFVQRALRSGNRRDACDWVESTLAAHRTSETQLASDERIERLRQTLYGFCVAPHGRAPYRGKPDEPTSRARVRRANLLYERVDYEAARDELESVELTKLDDQWRCRGRFRLGRTFNRLDEPNAARSAYRKVVTDCDRSETADERISSLYALGTDALGGDDRAAKRYFERILNDYPERSHADDALMYLGRIARRRGATDRVETLLRRALEAYPDGDMVHQFVWEYVESAFRDGNYRLVIDRLDALDLPRRDDQYFSQGRLLYVRAVAESELGNSEAADEHFRAAWTTYPFSFYGYLARLRLQDRDATNGSLRGSSTATPPDWFYDPDWDGRAIRRLTRLGLPQLGARLMRGRIRTIRAAGDDPEMVDWWRLAYLQHRAGEFAESHDIPRLEIPGRPWVEPTRSQRQRWRIAYPRPHGGLVEQAIEAESRRRPDARVSRHLPLAIMREESGFDVDVESWAGALGLMQLMPMTAESHADDMPLSATDSTLRTAEVNVRIGVRHLFMLADRFENHPAVMAAAYNAGSGAVGGWLPSTSTPEADRPSIALWAESIPYLQARRYVKRVMGTYAAYQWRAGRSKLDARVGEPPPAN